MNKKILIISGAVLSIFVVLILAGTVLSISYIGGFGKCNFGEAIYFKGTRNETCAKFGTKIDPLPVDIRILRVTKSAWNGWSQNQPEDEVQDYYLDSEIILNEITLKGLSESETSVLKIKKYNGNSIDLNIDNLSLKQGADLSKNTINLNGCGVKDFTISLDETVELNTCSMDAGVTWTLEYL
jgi:hypothetical protein